MNDREQKQPPTIPDFITWALGSSAPNWVTIFAVLIVMILLVIYTTVVMITLSNRDFGLTGLLLGVPTGYMLVVAWNEYKKHKDQEK